LNIRDRGPVQAVSSRPSTPVDLQPLQGTQSRQRTPENIDDWEARLAADDELIKMLAWESYSGQESEKLYSQLAEYGTQIIGAWLYTGLIFSKCAAKGIRAQEFANPIPVKLAYEREDIVVDTVSRAVVGFRDTVLKKGKWSAARGATLKTFFIGQALIRFVNVYRAWVEARRLPTTPLLDSLPVTDPHLGDPQLHLTQKEDLREGLATVEDATVRNILALEGLGYDQAQIAEILGLPSPKSVEMRKYRRRRQQGDSDVA
jgi:DNA-directed RNA polymerase specialized sigma24 family protein